MHINKSTESGKHSLNVGYCHWNSVILLHQQAPDQVSEPENKDSLDIYPRPPFLISDYEFVFFI